MDEVWSSLSTFKTSSPVGLQVPYSPCACTKAGAGWGLTWAEVAWPPLDLGQWVGLGNFSRIPLSSVPLIQLFATTGTAAQQASLSITNPQSLLKFMSFDMMSWWCHPIISSSAIPFSSCLQSFPASGSFSVSQFFASGGQSSGVSTSASVLPMNIQGQFPLGWTGWISLQSKGLSRVFSNTTVQKRQFFSAHLSLQSNSHIHTWLLEKPEFWLYRPLLVKSSLDFLMCCLGWS